jgi:hypothetical protein
MRVFMVLGPRRDWCPNEPDTPTSVCYGMRDYGGGSGAPGGGAGHVRVISDHRNVVCGWGWLSTAPACSVGYYCAFEYSQPDDRDCMGTTNWSWYELDTSKVPKAETLVDCY